MIETIAERREKSPLYRKLRAALEASGLPVVASSYVLRFPDSPILFHFNFRFDEVCINEEDLDRERLSPVDKNILAVALLLGIEKDPGRRVFR